MGLEEHFEKSMWASHQEQIDQELSRFMSALADLNNQGADISAGRSLAVQAYSAISTHLFSAAKVVWLMTGRNAVRKEQVAKELDKRYGAIEATIFGAIAAYWPSSANFPRTVVQNIFLEIRSRVQAEFLGLADPLAPQKVAGAEAEAPPTHSYNPRLSILFVSAEPSRAPSGRRLGEALNLDVEFREIQRAIEVGQFRDQIDITPVLASTAQELLDNLNRVRPRIVHFSGHGTPAQGIVLVDDDGNAFRVGPDFLATVFTTLSSSIEVVVLNACYSADQAAAIGSSIAVTIGTNSTISDKAAIGFSRAFYSAIANGLTVAQAFGQADAMLVAFDGANKPTIHSREHVNIQKLRMVRDPSEDNFEPLGNAMAAATGKFLTKSKRLVELLGNLEALPIPEIIVPPAGPVDGRIFTSLTTLRELIEGELAKCKEYGDALDGISRRWSRHLGDSAIAKLTRLEQVVATCSENVRNFTGSLFGITDALARKLELEKSWSEETTATLVAVQSGLKELAKLLRTTDQSVRVHYNQLIEFLPGNLAARGLLRPL